MNFEAVLAALPDAVIVVDGELRVVFWNSAAEELTGRSRQRVEGRAAREVLPPESSVVRRLNETLATGESRSETDSVLELTETINVPVSVTTAPLFDQRGEVRGAVGVVRDLSRIRQLETEVRRAETLASAGRMAMGLAHEIRNPLGAIRGAVQLLARELDSDERLRKYTHVVIAEVDRVNRTIEMALDLGRPTKTRMVPLNLHQLLERVVLLHEEAARSQNISVIRRYDLDLPAILGDEDRLLQVFHNLIRNSLEAMPAGGHVTLTTRMSLSSLFGKMDMGHGQQSMAEVQVTDEGGGIPRAAQGKVFDPFFTTKTNGLGLGLAICHRILEDHRGAMQIESVGGRGTTVTCFLRTAR